MLFSSLQNALERNPKWLIGLIGAMALVVVASNVLVQYPFNANLGGVNLADICLLYTSDAADD